MPISTLSRPQPPSINDPQEGEAELWTLGKEGDDESTPEAAPDWLKRAKDAFQFSTSYVDNNYRKQWDDSIDAFNSIHPGDSKYNSELFRKRSRIFRPKTRAIIRKNEAAAAAAYFSNLDRTSITAVNQADVKQRISATIMEQILQYRLTKSIPWFQIVQGAMQDAQVQACAVAHVYWSYVANPKDKGQIEVKEDKPVVDLKPIENIRFDPAASWIDPINTSPYLIDLIPMYVIDVKARMERPDPKGRTWRYYDDSILMNCMGDDDSTRRSRNKGEDATQKKRAISDYDVIWVHRHIHRHNGQDYEFYTLKSDYMLTDPEPLKNTVFHGLRPYVLGVVNLETHKPLPTTIPMMARGLQDEMNENVNQRLDNVKLVMNKRYFAKRGKNVDMASLVRNVPAGITLMDDVEADVKVIDYQDVTQSAYLEQDRLNTDFDELLGNFSATTVQMSRPGMAAVGMQMAQAPANLLTEYMLKTFTETFVIPVLRHLVLLEQHYETDNNILAIAGQQAAPVLQKFGVDKVTDDMLEHEVTVNVNVGMGATDPGAKLQRFGFALQMLEVLAKSKPMMPWLQLQEVSKEIFGLSGYQDGSRFMSEIDPDKVQSQQQIMQMMNIIKQMQLKLKDKSEANQAKIITGREKNQTAVVLKLLESDHEMGKLFADFILKSGMESEQPQGNGSATVQ